MPFCCVILLSLVKWVDKQAHTFQTYFIKSRQLLASWQLYKKGESLWVWLSPLHAKMEEHIIRIESPNKKKYMDLTDTKYLR